VSSVKTLAKGQLVIPAPIRKKYGIKPGAMLQILDYGGVIHLIPPVDDPVQAACGILPPKPSLTKQLLRERQGDFKQ